MRAVEIIEEELKTIKTGLRKEILEGVRELMKKPLVDHIVANMKERVEESNMQATELNKKAKPDAEGNVRKREIKVYETELTNFWQSVALAAGYLEGVRGKGGGYVPTESGMKLAGNKDASESLEVLEKELEDAREASKRVVPKMTDEEREAQAKLRVITRELDASQLAELEKFAARLAAKSAHKQA